jgi:chromosome segregation ATPase
MNAEGEAKLKQQQKLYEAVRTYRKHYSKNLIEAQDEIAEMKRKQKIMNHQIEQLKEEITAKDQALVKEHFDHKKVEKEREQLKQDKNKMQEQINEQEQLRITQTAEITKLNSIINEGDNELQRQKKEYDNVVNERNILGTQLIRRNDELALLYEKIKIQRTTLKKGEMQYRERCEDIRMLKIKINDLRRELHIVKSNISNIDILRNEVYHLQRELLQERTKVKALSEELENPMNVHRWRKLEGSDPGTYEMIQKIQTLQKRLIAKTEEVVEKDLLIQEKEKLYIELKNILARQPGPEVAEQLSVYQQNLREKTRQMKAMASELNMYQAQVNEYKYEIERLTRELQDVKRRYFEQKRREQLAVGTDMGQKGYPIQQRPNGPRFTGGGFSLGA